MSRYQKRLGYLVAIVATTAVLLLRLALTEQLAEQARLLPFVIAVMAAAWWGGLKPGLLATLLGAFLGILFVVPPADSLRIETVADGLNAAIFVFVGVTISLLFEELHAARRNEAEKQFRTLADSVAQLVWMARPDGHRFWFNQRWYDYTGTTLKQVEGDGWQTACDPVELPRVLKSWKSALATGTPWEETYRLRRKDGQSRWFLARAVPSRNELGEIVRWCGTSTDIHDRIETEQALRDADARKDQYLATLAHELRNPLSPISNALKLWPFVADDKAELEHLRTVMVRQVKQLIRLIDDLLDMARISRGKIALRRGPVNLSSLVSQAVETVQPLIDAAGHELTVTTPEEPVYVQGDSDRLTQVFSNILNNAAKYTIRNGVIAVAVEKQGDQAVVRIRDNGPGIPVPMLTKIFDAFVQVDRTVDSSQGGLGIGLTLARQLVNLHGGELVARSAGPGQGSEFVVLLPALAALPADEEGCPAPLPQQTGRVNRRRLLVVDDFEESADLLARLLRNMGHDATALHDGEAAIEWILAHQPDAVLLDIAMPGLDGYEVARRLRMHPELQDTVLVALTGYGQKEDRKRALDAGFNFHLIKPASTKDLDDLLHSLPERRAMTEAMAL